MNIKKSFLVALAATTAISSVSALAVSAAGLGESTGKVEETVTIVADKDATVEAVLEDAKIEVTIPAGALEEGDYTFNADIVVNTDVQKAIDDLGLGETEILDLYFTDKGGTSVSLTGKDVTVKVETTKYSYAYIYEDSTKKLSNLNATKSGDVLTFKAPHFSYYVLATKDVTTTTVVDNTTSTTSTASNTTKTGTNASTSSSTTTASSNTTTGKGDSVTTGDTATATTVAVFAVMGVVALGTAVVASKMKKSSK